MACDVSQSRSTAAVYRSSFPDRGDRLGFGGYRKFTKCSQQMAAYRFALNERVGYKCDVGLIIVSTPETSQAIFIDGDQMDLHESRFLKRAQMFHALEDSDETENCSQ